MAIDLSQATSRMKQSLDHLHEELKKIRTGRANPGMLDGVMIDAYGQSMPLKHAASVVAVDGQLLQVTPFDPSNLAAISIAISESSLGLNPSDDGHVVRVPVPPLTEDRRRELVKSLNERAEEARVALRNIRHDVLKDAKSQQQNGELSEDEYNRADKQLGELMDEHHRQIDNALSTKQAELMTV